MSEEYSHLGETEGDKQEEPGNREQFLCPYPLHSGAKQELSTEVGSAWLPGR